MLGRLIGLVALAATAASALAGPQTFAQRAQNIRAGIVILDSSKPSLAGVPVDYAPYALYNLDSATTVKPAGWNFYNPFAPSRVTPSIQTRWLQIDPSNTPAVGTPISKRNAAYWEVILSQTSDTQLANYDFLMMSPRYLAQLSPLQQNRLRRFVDGGGVLWIDGSSISSSPGLDLFNSFPFPFNIISGGGLYQTDFTNSLMNSIHALNSSDVYLLNRGGSNILTSPTLTMTNLGGGTLNDFNLLQGVSFVGSQPNMMVGRIGEGVVAVTSNGSPLALNRSSLTGSYVFNTGFVGLDPFLAADGLVAAKLAVNMVGMLRESRQQGSSSRKVSSSAIDLNPPLLQRSNIADSNIAANLTAAGVSNNTPTLYKGLLVVTTNGQVKVFDANPITDIDEDGNPDDGLQDYSVGKPYDEIWESSQLPGPLSPPVCAEVPGSAAGTPQDEVLVVDATGTLHIFNLMPRDPNTGALLSTPQQTTPIAPPSGASDQDLSLTGLPLAPTVHEGVAYICDNQTVNGQKSGRIWAVDLQHGQYVSNTTQGYSSSTNGAFVIGGNNSTVNFPEFSYGPTVGYIPIYDNSGGLDKVLYVPFAPNGSTYAAAGFSSIWIGSRGEVPSQVDPLPGTTGSSALQVTTRASLHGSLPIYTGTGSRAVKLTVLDSSGTPWTDAQMSNYFSNVPPQNLGSGILSFAFKTGVTGLPATVSGFRLDYTIDWGDSTAGALSQVERGHVVLPDTPMTPDRVINGAVALSPQGTAYVVHSTAPSGTQKISGGPGASLYGFREQGFGSFNCIMRYELYGQYNTILNQTTEVTVPAVMSDHDSIVQQFAPMFLGNPALSNFEIRGGPAIRNGQVFITVAAKKATSSGAPINSIPATILMALNAEPQTATINVGSLTDGFQVIQSDFAKSSITSAPESQSVLGSGFYSYDAATGILTFPTLADTTKGQITNCISLSQPVIIRQTGTPDRLVYPDTVGGSVWNPVQWFHVIDGAYPGGGTPLVTGNSVFIGVDSYLYSVLNGAYSGGIPGFTGLMYGVNAQIPAAQLHPLAAQPWLNQLWTIDSTAPFTADPNVVWPQISAATSFEDFKVKLNQTVLSATSTSAYGAIGGDGALAAWGDTGLYTFAKSNFLICDEGRILEMDPSGNPIWSTSSTTSAGQSAINTAGVTKPLIRPTKAYKLGESTILFADAGANRVATMDKNGVEQRSITGFQLDPTFTPGGYAPGETLVLSGPRDALYYTTVVNVAGGAASVSIGDNEISNYEFWQHYLVADTGNKRLVEVIDRFYYNPNTQQVGQPVTVAGAPQVGVLLWHSPASVSGRQYAYSSVSRVLMPGNGPSGGHYVYVCGINGTLPTRVGAGLDSPSPTAPAESLNGTGGIVIYDPLNPAGAAVFNEIATPDVSATQFWDPNSGTFDNLVDTSTTYGAQVAVRRKGGAHRLNGLTSVTAKVLQLGASSSTTMIAIMVADGTGVYEVQYDPTQGASQSLGVDWMMPNEVYRNIFQTPVGLNLVPSGTNAKDLRAVFARRLDSGEVLIVNGYYGATVGNSPFSGEVMQVDGTINSANFSLLNLGFNSKSVTLDLRTAGSTAFRGLVLPVFADRR